VNRLKKAYAEKGASAFDHGNKGKARPWKTDAETEERIAVLYKAKYEGFNFRHFLEKLNEEEGISITYKPLHRILTAAGFKSPKRHKSRKEKVKHPSRPRRQCFGELLQIDASIHNWFGDPLPKATLHGAIDDATGTVMGLFFDREETLKGYYEMMWQILNKYGIPEAFYGDNRTIFEFRRLSEKNQTIDRDVHINFKRMCMQLGIELITTSVSQAKGRIERLWGTLQSRLISELRLRGVTTIDAANSYLPEFMADYNRRFAVKPDLEASLFAPSPSPKEIDFYLSTEFQRVADNGSSFGFMGRRFQLVDDDGTIARIPTKTVIDIYVTRLGKRVAVFDGRLWDLVEIERRQVEPKPKKAGRPPFVPGPNHPWRKFVINPKKG
jgi:transposase